MPVLFISYSHDSDSDTHHRDKVLAFALRLRLDGFDTRLDQFLNGGPAEGWPRWMLDQLDLADFVLPLGGDRGSRERRKELDEHHFREGTHELDRETIPCRPFFCRREPLFCS